MLNYSLVLILLTFDIILTQEDGYFRRKCTEDDIEGMCVPSEDCNMDSLTITLNPVPAFKDGGAITCPNKLTCCKIPDGTPNNSATCGILNAERGASADPSVIHPIRVPWNVALMWPIRMEDNMYKMLHLGNGVLIHDKVVLTTGVVFNEIAEQKKRETEKSVYAVVADYNQMLENHKKKALKVKEIIVHPQFIAAKATNNFALAFLSASSRGLAPSTRPACLPPQDYQVPAGTKCFYTGWGRFGNNPHRALLSTTMVPIVDHYSCSMRSRPFLGSRYVRPATFVCAGGNPGQDHCNVGTGAPLVCPRKDDPSTYELVGLMSYTSGCGPVGRPAIFADVATAISWILSEAENRTIEF